MSLRSASHGRPTVARSQRRPCQAALPGRRWCPRRTSELIDPRSLMARSGCLRARLTLVTKRLSSASARDGSDGVYAGARVDKTIDLNFPLFALPKDAIGEARRHAG